jgi:two-component system, NtrC family, sensor kinase
MSKLTARNRSRLSVTKVEAPTESTPLSSTSEAGSGETSSAHARLPGIIPIGLLDRLFVATLELPILDGERAVVEAMVEAVAATVPTCAVGVCFVLHDASTATGISEQVVIERLPHGASEVPAGVDPTRLFPTMAREYVAPLSGADGSTGSTFHVASNDDDLERETSTTVHLVDRAAMALGRALDNARTIASLGGKSPDVRALEQRLLQADKLASFGQIAAGVVHELNNPLTSIVAYSDYLIRKSTMGSAAPDGEDVERLRRISESATRMLRFTRELVSYARPSSGVAGPVVLHEVIDQAIAFCEHVLTAAAVRVDRRYGAGVLTVRAVSEQLVQVFVNLLTNASHAAPAHGGRVVVTTALVQPTDGVEQASIVVEDNGSGIEPEHLPQVFVPFFTTKRHMQGTGLGLSIVKSILESHDGAIHVDSERGRGTRFVIRLPVRSGA